MFARRRGLPEGVAGKGLIAASRLDGPQESWLLAFDDRLTVLVGEEVEDRWWHEFEGARWRDATRTLTLAFVDADVAPLRLVLAEGERIALVVRERVEHSIVFQEHAALPSGLSARGLVRRDGEGSLFTQILVDGQPTREDETRLTELDASIRDTVGMALVD